MTNTLILPDWLITTALEPPRKNWGVRVVADRIAEVATHADLHQRYPTDDVWEAAGQVLSPGFVNAHIHLYGVLAHGIPVHDAPEDFWGFLKQFWWPLVEDRLDQAMILAATDLQCARMLKSGVTSFYDCLEAPQALPGILTVQADVVRRHGMRGILSFEATERVSEENGQAGLTENADFIDACRAQGGLVSGLMCFHTTFTCSKKFIRQAFKLGRERNVLTHMHCAEGDYEPRYTLKKYGKRPILFYDDMGVTGPHMLASQCVQINQAEMNLIVEQDVRVTHMPLSNCEVGGGIAPIPQLIDMGAMVGLGSDGYIDNFFEVARGAFLIHKANQRDPRVMPADMVWYHTTTGGAAVLELERVGQIEPGWQADLQLIDLTTLPTPPTEHNLYEQLILYRNDTDVRAVMVNGQVRVRDDEVLNVDMAQLIARTREQAQRLWKK